jgi:hypothetical protein
MLRTAGVQQDTIWPAHLADEQAACWPRDKSALMSRILGLQARRWQSIHCRRNLVDVQPCGDVLPAANIVAPVGNLVGHVTL